MKILHWVGFVLPFSALAQTERPDTVVLPSADIVAYKQDLSLRKLADVHGTYIIGGRKSEVIQLQDAIPSVAEKQGRQIFARIPGVFVYDMDGSGNQINIATRGLDPHRSWEFNIRQNGVVINSDLYGYPASHYSPPMEAIKSIEIVRGTAALQYGAEFGGMINYVTKGADTSRQVSFESLNTVGSFGLFSSFQSLGGKVGKLTYYGYYQRRTSDGYRRNASSDAQAQFVSLQYDISQRARIRAEAGRNTYLFRIPGPLTDSMFAADPRQATRSRNYFSPDIVVPSVTFEWEPSDRTRVQWVFSGVFGSRNSVEFEGFADKPDAVDTLTGLLKSRAINVDGFNSKTSELRVLHNYKVSGVRNILSAGIRYFNNTLHRRQQGKGTTGNDYDLTISGNWGRDLYYRSQSIALMLENLIQVTERFSVSPGFRYEYGNTDMSGYISYLPDDDVPNRIAHCVPALGINTRYRFSRGWSIYGGISQAHRPVIFKDIIPTSSLERANKNLKNATGYNAEIGLSGRIKGHTKIELTAFRTAYQNRLGNLAVQEDSSYYIYKTNIGNSLTHGLELYAEVAPLQTATTSVSFFTATSLMRAVYTDAQMATGTENKDISGNEVESVPRLISRNGAAFSYKIATAQIQYSYVSATYSDPANTEQPTANGARGKVPAYGIWDVSLMCRIQSRYTLRAGINNVTDTAYFTKRPLFYPGPGIWPSDGRSFVISLGVRI